MAKESVGQRGKDAEKKVEQLLKSWSTRANTAYHRLPDTRSAGSYLPAQPADIMVFCGGMKFLEVKTTSHAFRLAKDKVAQLPVLRKFSLAGTPFGVLVFHSAESLWRFVPGAFFELEGMPASWDLRGIPTHPSHVEALESSGWFG